MYEGTWESVGAHPVPGWFEDAKLGVFLHWGLYSVPGWAPQVPDINEMLRTEGPEAMLRSNPYAEWYLNSMQIDGSPTQKHHRDTYGADFPYDRFREVFDAGIEQADMDRLARVCEGAGARYVVLTTKHHDGFTLWPASVPHPRKGAYHAARDLVGDVSAAIRARGMRMGLYYSGGYDWPFNDAVISNPADTALAVPGDGYVEYATAHVRELIDAYGPSVLWNDVCWPAGGNLAGLFAYYYNTVPEGVINDRWLEATTEHSALGRAGAHALGTIIQHLWRFLPAEAKSLTFPSAHHFDFNTPEYAQFDTIVERKWEATRGVGHSFGANRNERPQDIVTATELVRTLCDIVSKNGNLLIGVGPGPDGVIPAEQVRPLEGLGDWLRVNGEAIYGTRPWAIADTTTTEGTPVHFTQREGRVYALLAGLPGRRDFSLRGLDATAVEDVRLVGVKAPFGWEVRSGELWLELPERMPVAAVQAVDLGRGVRPTT